MRAGNKLNFFLILCGIPDEGSCYLRLALQALDDDVEDDARLPKMDSRSSTTRDGDSSRIQGQRITIVAESSRTVSSMKQYHGADIKSSP